ncbi:hypothetical protein [Streptomyces sp. WAC05374]|uniref:hypothetical protein n=1 Tax=Streptomyces sp. WAC05374 TaxID=2487420 RepID=UPI000F893889|nr:hypothetical protein [Streptomyces sp. WAC05374]RST16375.1 hypothetical protein EF905_12570 [Streptomyces sp. WAC05374]
MTTVFSRTSAASPAASRTQRSTPLPGVGLSEHRRTATAVKRRRLVAAWAELLCRVSAELEERGTFAPPDARDLQAIGRRLGEIDAARRAGLWANALAADPAWDHIRLLARRFLLTTLGDWRQPLPRPARPYTGNH